MSGKHNLYKRGEIWWFKKRRKGQKPIRESLETRSLKQAQERRDRLLAELNAGRWGEKRNKTFNEAVSKWVDDHIPNLKPKSRERYRVSLVHLLDEFDNTPLKDVTSSKLSDFETRRRKQGVTPATIRRDLACLSSLLSSAEDWEWIDSNPVLQYMRRRSKRGLTEAQPRTRHLAPMEEPELLDVCSERVFRCIAFAIDTGLRKEEQFSLLKSDIDLAAKVVRVRKEVTKSTRPRTVPLLPRALEIAKELLADRVRSPFLFTTPAGKRYSETSHTMYTALQRAAKRAGLEKLSWHDLRRTCGCRLLNQYGLQMHEVSAWLGHSSIKVTEKTYAFLEDDRLNKRVRAQSEAQFDIKKAAND